ncbi:MAG: adenosylcobinamide-GDP ribazoletransferase [Anaerolineales bacterium]|nr:adenosylcobinamide-GDP ribazoletransferase [Anaerolineales bacterium]
MQGLWTALSFLTILPVRKPGTRSPRDLGKAAIWFPLVGVLLGVLLVGFYFLLDGRVPDRLRAGLLLGLWVLLSGGLHLDGLADCLDGLLVTADRERRLTILRDPGTGAFAVIGISLFLILKAAALEGLTAATVLLLAPAAGRSVMLLGMFYPSAREGGLGAVFKSGLTPLRIGAASFVPLLLAGTLGMQGFLALILAILTALLVFQFAKARIGGVTGDVLGAACELSELVVLFLFVVS